MLKKLKELSVGIVTEYNFLKCSILMFSNMANSRYTLSAEHYVTSITEELNFIFL